MKPRTIENIAPLLTKFSDHILKRMSQRGITTKIIELTHKFGRQRPQIYGRGVKCYVIGKKELDYFHKQGFELRSAEGVHAFRNECSF